MLSYSIKPSYFFAPILGVNLELSTSNLISSDIDITLYPRWYKHIAVQWSVPATWPTCLFNVYFSQVEDSGFEKLNLTPINGNYLIDKDTQEYRNFNNGFYVVEAVPQDGSAIIRSKSVTWSTERSTFADIRAREINRREYFLLSKFVGVKSFLFKRKTYGKRCTECWDYKTEKITKDHCHTCLGTGFEDGFYAPAPCYVQYNPTGNSLERGYNGVTEPNANSGWTIAFPEAHPSDVLIKSGDWEIHRIEEVSCTELQSKTVKQTLTMVILGKEAIENYLIDKIKNDFPEDYK